MRTIQFVAACLGLAIPSCLIAPIPKPLHAGELANHSNSAPQQRSRGNSQRRVYKARISPNWFADGTKFWYRNELPGGKREFILVDALAGERKLAFDHQRLADALSEKVKAPVDADKLRIDGLVFEKQLIYFRFRDESWQSDLNTYALTKVDQYENQDGANRRAIHPDDLPRASTQTGAETEVRFTNRTQGSVQVFWLDTRGARISYGRLPAGETKRQHTYAGHYWIVVDGSGNDLAAFQAQEDTLDAIIDGKPIDRGSQTERTRGRRIGSWFGTQADRSVSPNEKWRASILDGNLFATNIENTDSEPIQLTEDATENESYAQISWAPDSRSLVVFGVREGERKEVYLIESSPPGGGRAKLSQRPYALPGDRFTSYELHLFRLQKVSGKASQGDDASQSDDAGQGEWQEVDCQVDSIDFGRPRIRWEQDSSGFTYTKTDRGHQRFRMIRVDATSGQARTVIDEQTDTFIWTAHTENLGLRPVTRLENSNEIIYISEADGRRHLYLIDSSIDFGEVESGKPESDTDGSESSDALEPQVANGEKRLFAPGLKNQITKGKFVVRGVDRIDEERGEIWFRASGGDPDQDPYFIHFYRVNFDGTGLIRLTAGNGNHSIQFSPDRRFIIDTHSRVDSAPKHTLRRAEDGSLICELEQADITELKDTGWRAPEVFVAKGRDGKTDIWGIICRPRDFDPGKSYPVIEDIYAGPHGSFVPKSFSSRERYSTLNELGFIVVKIDGMGTANRSKDFHDVCWHNLKDAGFPDRIGWMKAAAQQHPEMDLSRVGIYGGSAGGQNAAAALLFHGDFYQVAVAGCGCHDNRMDKASWNEQWMGYPVGPQYSECSNIDNAWRLQGKLMLIVGEMDTNVPPESTLRFADALIKADKDFDLIVVPGAGHGMGGRYGTRRMNDFFVEHLIDQSTDQ